MAGVGRRESGGREKRKENVVCLMRAVPHPGAFRITFPAHDSSPSHDGVAQQVPNAPWRTGHESKHCRRARLSQRRAVGPSPDVSPGSEVQCRLAERLEPTNNFAQNLISSMAMVCLRSFNFCTVREGCHPQFVSKNARVALNQVLQTAASNLPWLFFGTSAFAHKLSPSSRERFGTEVQWAHKDGSA